MLPGSVRRESVHEAIRAEPFDHAVAGHRNRSGGRVGESSREAGPALLTAGLDDGPPGPGTHASTEAVLAGTSPGVRLIGALHRRLLVARPMSGEVGAPGVPSIGFEPHGWRSIRGRPLMADHARYATARGDLLRLRVTRSPRQPPVDSDVVPHSTTRLHDAGYPQARQPVHSAPQRHACPVQNAIAAVPRAKKRQPTCTFPARGSTVCRRSSTVLRCPAHQPGGVGPLRVISPVPPGIHSRFHNCG